MYATHNYEKQARLNIPVLYVLKNGFCGNKIIPQQLDYLTWLSLLLLLLLLIRKTLLVLGRLSFYTGIEIVYNDILLSVPM